MSVQLRPALVLWLDNHHKKYDDGPQLIVRNPTFPKSEGYAEFSSSPRPDGQAQRHGKFEDSHSELAW
jgi:hypothetical protein